MLARCSRCAQTFQTDRYGEQFCPFCGAQVLIAPPPGAAPPGAPLAAAPPPPGAPPPQYGAGYDALGPQDQEAPVDRPEAHGGWFMAAIATWKRTITNPLGFYDRLKPGPETGGALTYLLVMTAVGTLLGQIGALATWPLQRMQMAQAQEQMRALGSSQFAAFYETLIKFSTPSPGRILLQVLFAPIGALLMAGILHLLLMLVGGNKKGFTATLRAYGFAQAPLVFMLVPMVGPMIGGIWALVLSVIGMARLHRVSVGRSLAAYGILFGLFFCCGCIGVLGIAASLAGSAAAVPH